MDPVLVAVVVGAFGLIGLGASEGWRRRHDGADAWRAAAVAVGGDAGRTPYQGLRARIGATEVRAAVADHIGARHRQTRVWAQARVRPQPRLALGTRRRKLESIALDPLTTAWTDRPRHVAARWTESDSARWRTIHGGAAAADESMCRLVSDGHTVELVIDGVVIDTARLVAALELVAKIANDDLGAAAALAELPSASPVPGALAVRLAPDDILVEIDPLTSTTVIRGTAEASGTKVRVRSADELARVQARWASPEIVAAFAASGAVALEISLGDTHLTWPKLELDSEKLRAGIAIIRRIAGDDRPTPYR